MPSHVVKEGAGLGAADIADGWEGKFRRIDGAVRVAACLATGLAILVATACSGSSNKIAQPLQSGSSAAPSSPDPSAAGPPSQQVLAQYRAFWSVLPAASAAPAGERQAMLAPYAADPELTSVLQGMREADHQGTVFYGRDVPRPTIRSVSSVQGIAVIRDCQDSSHAGNKDRRTGRRLTVGVARHLVVATMNLGPDGRWRVASVSYEKSKC